MSGADKARMADFLEENGWTEIEEGLFDPPSHLFNQPPAFGYSDAITVQELFEPDNGFFEDG